MIAADKLQTRTVNPAPFGRPESADAVLLNCHQIAGMLDVPNARLREALLSSRVKPCRIDGRGNALFTATRLHELAGLLGSQKAQTAFVLKFGPPWAETQVRIDPPVNTPQP